MAEILCREIVNLARSCRAQLIVLNEFPTRYRPVLDCFVRRGFARAPSMPMTALNIEHDDFDAYMQNALPRSARWQLRKKFKATNGETIALTVTDDARDAVDEIYPLYLQVASKHGSQLRTEIPDAARSRSARPLCASSLRASERDFQAAAALDRTGPLRQDAPKVRELSRSLVAGPIPATPRCARLYPRRLASACRRRCSPAPTTRSNSEAICCSA
jgi:hypothetical protein